MISPLPPCLGEYETSSPQRRAENDCVTCAFMSLCKGDVEPVWNDSIDVDKILVCAVLTTCAALLVYLIVSIIGGSLL